ncbi:unnamed protein product [Meloidogyne enterolobii]|uniref:Uncharacterized protein n=1 Tax=Meloidogyne enterolobii TaxID=390850 RepID=A0ACB0Z3P9_MELEN
MNSSTNDKNQEINHEPNIKANDDFFDGLDEYLEKTMGINIKDNYAMHTKGELTIMF